MRRVFVLAIACLMVAQSSQVASAKPKYRSKKVIQWGFDEPSTQFMRENIESMEQFPFDGVIFHAMSTKGEKIHREMWGNRKFEFAEFEHAVADLKATPFKSFTDRFLRVNVQPGSVDWFDDEAWAVVLQNSTIAARIAKQGNCKGFMFDTESYVTKLFKYSEQPHRSEKSFSEYQAKVRQRGKQWMATVNAEFPDIKILMTFGYAESGRLQKNAEERVYGLLADFLDGMLDVCTPQTRIIDAWERSFGYKQQEEFVKARDITQTQLPEFAASSRQYLKHIQTGFAVWMDNRHHKIGWHLDDFSKNHFTPAQFEESVRLALATSDEYVWVYTEKPRWWPKQEQLPQPYIDALRKARD
jgi:hypothetical protein